MAEKSVSIEPQRFATLAVNALHAAFIDASRAQAKRHFARVHGGAVLDVARLKMEDGAEVQFRVALDHSQFRGRFGFTVFRKALEQLLHRLADRIRFKESLNLYTSSETGAVLFNVPSIIEAEGTTNVFMLGVDKPETGLVTVRLQFLDPAQFKQQA
jgi:hypothetical protein